jgi:hypothetical protein
MVGSGGVCVLQESGVRFCAGTFGRNLGFSRREDVFTHFYKFCTFNAICKDNAAISCITLQHKKVLSTLRTRTEMVVETLVFSPFNHLTVAGTQTELYYTSSL